MTATATVTIAATVTGLPTGTKAYNLTFGPFLGAVAETLDVALVTGNNVITVPAGASWVLIQPPSGNTVQITLQGNGTDVGFALHKTNASLLPLVSGTTQLLLNAASGVTPEINFI